MRKLKITKEDAVVFESDHIGCVNVSLGNTGFDPFIYVWNHQYPLGKEEAISNAQLIADAFNTANKCDMLPSELLEQSSHNIKELLGLLEFHGYTSSTEIWNAQKLLKQLANE